jgi:prophage antirepressor-like protein
MIQKNFLNRGSMEAIQVFNNVSFGEVRIAITGDDEPVFCLADLCKILDIKNVSDCKSRLNAKGVVITDTLTAGGIQKVIFINESNFYKVVFQSQKSDAESFNDALFDLDKAEECLKIAGEYIKPS